MNFSLTVTTAIKNQNKWIEENWGTFDIFNDSLKKGDVLTIPVNCIVPRSKIEWDNAEAGQSKNKF